MAMASIFSSRSWIRIPSGNQTWQFNMLDTWYFNGQTIYKWFDFPSPGLNPIGQSIRWCFPIVLHSSRFGQGNKERYILKPPQVVRVGSKKVARTDGCSSPQGKIPWLRNPAVDRWLTSHYYPLLIGFQPSKLVQDFATIHRRMWKLLLFCHGLRRRFSGIHADTVG